MDESRALENCSFSEQEYNHSEKVCPAEKCLICIDGKWVEDKVEFVL